ncbi:probable gluconokinase isoform X4 [Rattus norvegicus]|uniref:probable gluconokinase isoform X4 n=1 Tax=Rattus norvegicus TaxID=10116 RepID=UPI002FD80137
MMSVFGRDLSRKQVLRTGEQGHGDTRGAAGDGSERLWELGWKFYDADDYHSEENRIKMGKGVPLNDQRCGFGTVCRSSLFSSEENVQGHLEPRRK